MIRNDTYPKTMQKYFKEPSNYYTSKCHSQGKKTTNYLISSFSYENITLIKKQELNKSTSFLNSVYKVIKERAERICTLKL